MRETAYAKSWFVGTLVLLALPAAGPVAAQHAHGGSGDGVHGGAHLVLLGTHVSPAVGGGTITEGYVTQPTLHGAFRVAGGMLSGMASVSLEGLTLERGELGPGTYGEGYIDRRHPHTYLHEAVLTLRPIDAVSLTGGRGFAPFGTDDPMVRPFVRFPANHHLGQVLERLVLIGAARAGPALAEVALFSGAEPEDPEDLGDFDRFGDSWSTRLTVLAAEGVELQASHARVTSPEFVAGEGWDQRKESVSLRLERPTSLGAVYALLEWKRTREYDDGEELFAFGSILGEASLARGGWSGAVRVERTERPEEERRAAYRTPWPHVDAHVLGISRWTIVSARVERALRWQGLRLAPFLEASHADIGMTAAGLFDPAEWYGSETINSISAGVRVDVGSWPARMGRYGVSGEW
jgi:hypothetical protein